MPEPRLPQSPEAPPERDERAKVMVQFLDTAKSIDALHGEKVEDVFANEESKREFFGNLAEEDFEVLISGINGILRGKEKGDWNIDGGDVFLSGFVGEIIPPRAEDKKTLLLQILEGAKEMIRNGRSIEDIALLVSVGINEIHLFQDANGRTSRLVYTLLIENFGEKAKEKINEVLSGIGRDSIDISPSFISVSLEALMREEAGIYSPQVNPRNITNLFYSFGKEFVYHEDVPKEARDTFENMVRRDSGYVCLAAFKFLSNFPDKDQFLQAFPGRSVILADRLSSELSADQLYELMEMYWSLKKKHTELLIDSIVNPEKSEYVVEENEQKMTILEKLKMGIKKVQSLRKK